ncbi:MAG: hypothetical protein GX575_26215 [Candidatus Anammoximicrobium sp.]|nr:hypothetical protein [Candidatus Anammoximicrobium sp.]
MRLIQPTIVVVLASFTFAASAADRNATVVTFKVIKQTAGMARETPELKLLSASDRWNVHAGPSWSGENLREIFFTLETSDATAELPQVAVTAPGIVPVRVIVGKQDVSFYHRDDTTTFSLVRDTRNAMLLNQVLTDPEGGLPIHIYHNWLIRQDGPFRGKPVPEMEIRAVLNYLVAAREALKLMGGTGPKDHKSFTGEITLMSFEVACARGHNDSPPHAHIMLWVPGYAGGEVPHFYMDAAGKFVRNGFGILGDEGGRFPERASLIAEKRKRSGEYGPGKPCQLRDLDDRLALELTITPDGGLLLSRAEGEPFLLIGGPGGPGDAVLVKQAGKSLLRACVTDDAERGETSVTVEHLSDASVARTLRQTLRYDPFTGLNRAEPAVKSRP